MYIAADKVIGVYGMGLTQHTHGSLNIAMLVNLLLLRGNIGRPGAGCCPVRGQRTRAAHRLLPLDKFYRGNGAHERIWKTPQGKAVFTTPGQLNSVGFQEAPGRYRLITMRLNDQFNTTIYGYSDRLRGLEGSRDILLMCRLRQICAGAP
ncbi:Molybdopterin oxidoreductase [Methylocapsa palsarum]|uniref:Molybdopterin oxidoreductase n=1 Tax=Methylocapsa palsarum TaxID=1612308 RepID=A0A1I4CZ99_9HYPH|nr:Molybdopterin oxidoreductase [Methylocapsa palsarum]